MSHFIAAKPSPAFRGLLQSLTPLYFAAFHSDTELKVTKETLALFKALENKTVIICPSHSHHEDGEVIFWLSSITHQKFSILTAREIFESHHGAVGLCLQKLGCYSISRGEHDKDAIRFTEQLLEKEACKLVIFPEGEISFNSDSLSHLHSGAVYMGLEACRYLLKARMPAEIYVLPLTLTYTYKGDVTGACNKCLQRMEKLLGLSDCGLTKIRKRVQRLFSGFLSREEKRWNLPTASCFDLRINNVLHSCIKSAAVRLRRPLPETDLISQIHTLQASVRSIKHSPQPWHITPEQLSEVSRDLTNAVSLHSINESRFSDAASVETFVEAIAVLEEILFRKVTCKGARQVQLNACEPINLLEYIQDYKNDRAQTIDNVTALMKVRMERSLAHMKSR